MASMNAEWRDVSWASLNLPLLQGECISPSEAQQKANDDDVFTALAGHGVHVDEDVLRIVCFLYMKRYRDDDDDRLRKEIPEFVVGAAKTRMLEILNGDICGVSDSGERFQTWQLWQLKLLQYTLLPGVSTIFTEKKKTLMLRKLTTPTSFLHPVASFFANKSRFDAKGISTYRAETVESSKMIRGLFNSDMLYKLVVCNKSSNSADLLLLVTKKHLVERSEVTIVEGGFNGNDKACNRITSGMEKDGPALVSGFRIDDKFNSCTGEGKLQRDAIFQFDCDDNDSCIRRQLILSRKDQEIDDTFVNILKDNHCGGLVAGIPTLTATESDSEESSSEVINGSHCFESKGENLEATRREFSNRNRKEDTEVQRLQGQVSSGGHAMVLAGYRRDEHGKLWFLLQNTWVNMFLIEVSASFLASRLSRMGLIVFLESWTLWSLPEEYVNQIPGGALIVESDLDTSDDPKNSDIPVCITDG